MQTASRSHFTTVKTEGGILPADLLQRVADGRGVDGQTPEAYHLLPGERLNEAINRSWNRCLGAWRSFTAQRETLPATDRGTTLTRERWLLILFQELGYGRLQFVAGGLALDATDVTAPTYPISHRWEHAPIHLASYRDDLDRRGSERRSPHSLVQEYLNRAEGSLWGFLSNGLRLRILRDNASLTRAAYVEFDLQAMMDGELYADFSLLWLVCHQSRVEGIAKGCWLERWSQAAKSQGVRALDALRDGVQEAIEALGRGFLAHPGNAALRAALQAGALSSADYYRQLLRVVYRCIILFVAEDRELLFPPEAAPAARERYAAHYSLGRLREAAATLRGSPHADLYRGLRLLFRLLRSGYADLGAPALGGFLFSERATPDLDDADINNEALLDAIRALTFTVEGRVRRGVDYRNLDSEELGSVYESLLELHPQVNVGAANFALAVVAGSERKTTGTHYTATPLVNQLLDSALEPVIEARLAAALDKAAGGKGRGRTSSLAASSQAARQRLADALLGTRVLDYACGSGHILIGAARRLARRLAQIRSGDEEPSPAELRAALREVVQHCIYGVDINPMAVELCKVALWLESLEPGKPLSFLDHHIQCGNSLVGVGPRPEPQAETGRNGAQSSEQETLGLRHDAPEALEVPDEAFEPVAGDDKTAARFLKKLNRTERSRNAPLIFLQTAEDLAAWRATRSLALEEMPEDSATQVESKALAYDEYVRSPGYLRQKLANDLWTAAFFWPIQPGAGTAANLAPTHGQFARARAGERVDEGLSRQAGALSGRVPFFHWFLAFPRVFDPSAGSEGGFDCVLSNPPWERIKLQEEEFFAPRDPEIASAPNKAARQRLIDALPETNPALHEAFVAAKHDAEAVSKFVRASGRFPLTAVGDVNTYALFAELARRLLAPAGCAGTIVPTGIATDDTTKAFFGDLVETSSLARLIGYENEDFIFPDVHHAFKFCLLTVTGREAAVERAELAFFCRKYEDADDPRRRFSLSSADFALINPNTRTCPIFRTRADAELTAKIYRRVSVLQNERTGENPWGVRFQAMFHMANDSGLFRTEPGEGLLPLYEAKMIWQYDHRFGSYEGRSERGFTNLGETPLARYQDPAWRPTPYYWVPETNVIDRLADVPQELIGFYRAGNERFAGQMLAHWLSGYWLNRGDAKRGTEIIGGILGGFAAQIDYFANQLGDANLERKHPLTERDLAIIQDPQHETILRIVGALIEARTPKWLMGFRDVTNATNERTAIFSALPRVGVGHTAPLIFAAHGTRPAMLACLLANLNCLPLDYVARQKIGGMHMTYSFLKQMPVLPPTAYATFQVSFVSARVMELSYTSWDIKPVADDVWREGAELHDLLCSQWEANRAATGGHAWDPPEWAELAADGCPLAPFKWDEGRRAVLRAELDAYYARLYGLTRDELRYILDPKDIHGPDFPGETFRVLKEKEERAYGEYRTRRLVLEAWDRME